MSTARKILSNTFIQFGGKIITAALSILVIKMITVYLGENGYGDYTLIYNYLALFGIVADFGIFTLTVKEMSQNKADIPMILGNALGLRTGLTVFAMALAVAFIFLIPKYQGTLIPLGVAIGGLSTLLTLLNGTISTVLQVHLKMQYETLGLILGKLVNVAYMVLVIYVWFSGDLTQGFYHLLWAGVVGNVVMLIVTSFYVRRYTPIRYRFDFKFWKKLFVTALPYGVALVLSNLYFRVDVILMSWILPRSTPLADGTLHCQAAFCSEAQVGLYGVAMRFLELLIIIPIYFMNAVLPVMIRYLKEGKERVKRLVQYAFDFLSAMGLPLMVGGILLATPLVQFVADEPFLAGEVYRFGSDTALRILMFAMFFSFLSNLFGITLVGLNQQKKLLWINLGGLMLNLGSNFWAIPRWGFVGAAVTSILCELLILILTAFFALQSLQLKISFSTSGKALLSASVMGLAVAGGSLLLAPLHFALQLGLLTLLGGGIYLGMIWLTQAVTPEMWQILKKKE